MVENNYVDIKQNSNDRDKVIKELNKLCENFIEKQGQYTHNQLDKRVTTVSQLKEPGKEEFIEKALNFACNIQYGDLRAQALSIIVPILDGQKNCLLYTSRCV